MVRPTLLLGFALALLSPIEARAQEPATAPKPATPAATPPTVTPATIAIAQPAASASAAGVAAATSTSATTAAPATTSATVVASAPGGAPDKAPTAAGPQDASSSAFEFATVIMTLFAAAALIAFVRALSRSTTWSLGDALSEEAGNQPPLPPGTRPVMVASASRTIALFGLFMMMSTVLGIGYYIVWALFHGRDLNALEKMTPFFYGSAAIFAPYAVNQMKEAFT